ncbi:MAG: rhodanese-like domain-containing protein [Bryobacteraceae bacterium]
MISDMPLEIMPAEVKRRLEAGEAISLIDVREPVEFQIAQITGSELVPMGTVPAHLQTLEDKAQEETLVILCHHGVRSLQVATWLRDQGIVNCQSMQDGIDLWSLSVDSSVPRY